MEGTRVRAGGSTAEPADARTRDRVLAAITEHGPVTAATLADTLGLTAAGVRRHLDHLAEAGLIVSRDATGKRGRGRPARAWVLSESGHEALPAGYDALALDALRFLRDRTGEDAVRAFADDRVGALEQRYAGVVERAGTDPAQRVEALVSALRHDGFAASSRPVAGPAGLTGRGIQLCQGHCPVQQAATEFPELCEAETDAFSRLLGVHVQRLATLARGAHVCTTFVPTTERSPR